MLSWCVRVGPGAQFSAKANIKIDVLGTLIVEGTAAAPASFMGTGSPKSWQGILIS